MIETTDIAGHFIADARTHLSSYLSQIGRCVGVLSDEEVWWRANDESNSIGNLLLHLSGNVRQWIVGGVGGLPNTRHRQQEFDERSTVPRAQLLARLKTTLSEADTVLATLDPRRLLERLQIQGHDVTMLRAIFHVVEHFSMHTGQIILLTKTLTAKDVKLYTAPNRGATDEQ